MTIYEKQNIAVNIKLLAAQRRLYSDAKIVYSLRIAVVFLGAFLTISAAAAFPDARVYIGAVSTFVGFLVSLLGVGREKRKNKEAAASQELFDTNVFSLPWNDNLAERPSGAVVSEAALRYTKNDLQDWYTDTTPVPRPLDILICQRSNLGWSIAAHRAWSALFAAIGLLLLLYATAAALLLGSSLATTLIGFYLPLIPGIKECVENWRSNADSIHSKQKVDGKALAIWVRAVEKKQVPHIGECRQLQDLILMSRQVNSPIPDWFYDRMKEKNQKAMEMSVNDYVHQVVESGLA
ncbi:S-4TM family putative pore-forming effector [Streptomyces cyaneofuscatus]|uniref:S-4TM family putative pore-forming effector n=1 Tax=Streptomyces cyaneofuscatus TaxID=66883 RepID=UPI003CE7CF38